MAEMEESVAKIRSRASFSSARDRESVLRVYREGIRVLSRRLADSGKISH